MQIYINNVNTYYQNNSLKPVHPSFKAQAPDTFVKNGLKLVTNLGCSDSIVADNPMPIVDFLKELSKTKHFKDKANTNMLNKYSKAISGSSIQEIEIKQMVGYGSSAIAFETKDGKILKLTSENHFPLNRPVEDFDAQVFAKGKRKGVYYYLVEKCLPCETGSGFVRIMKEKIHSKGYKANDFGEYDDFQIGFNEKGELKLLDPECATYKTPFHKLASLIKNMF